MKSILVMVLAGLLVTACITGVQVQTDHGSITFNEDNKISAEIEYEGATVYIEDNEVVAVELPNVVVEAK